MMGRKQSDGERRKAVLQGDQSAILYNREYKNWQEGVKVRG
jgi:hypothetical protein